MIKYAIYIIMFLGGIFCSTSIIAQQADSAWWDMSYIRNADAWLASGNVLGLKYLSIKKISVANIVANKSNGDFVNFYQSNNSYTVGASTESFYRLNPKVVFQGKVVYEDFNGKNMGGSAFINPYEAPLDIDEYADSTKGKKKLERYNLVGAVSAQLNSRWTLAGKIDYEAANYAKMKDLRHINKLLNLDAAFGASYTVSKTWEIGASYDYIRRIESVKFAIYGNTDRQYLSLINFGSFYGLAQLHGDYSYTGDERPMVNNTHKASLQLNIKMTPRLQFFNEFSYSSRTGYFGERGTASIVYTEHSATQYGYKGILSIKGTESLQNIAINANHENLKNNANVYRSETTSAGNTAIVYYGQTEVLDQDVSNAGIEYTGYFHVNNSNPLLTLKAGTDYFRREQTVIQYPFYRKQLINSFNLHVFANKNIINNKNMYGLSLGAMFGAGGGIAKNDGTYLTSSSGQPASKDNYLYQEYEYFTAKRIRTEIGLQYSRIMDAHVAAYIRLQYAYTKAFSVTYVGNNFNAINFTVGCTF